jgi:hypothetical protein
MVAAPGAVTSNVVRTDASGATEANVAASDARAVQPPGSETARRTAQTFQMSLFDFL